MNYQFLIIGKLTMLVSLKIKNVLIITLLTLTARVYAQSVSIPIVSSLEQATKSSDIANSENLSMSFIL